MALLFLIFVGVLSSSSLSVDAAQTGAGNIPASGTISDTLVRNSTVISGTDSPYGGSVVYSVSSDTEYYLRLRVPSSSNVSFYIHFFNSYPSLGSRASFYSNDFDRKGDFVTFHFTTSSNTTFVVLSFRFLGSYDSYEPIHSFIQSASIGNTLGLYSPLFNQSTISMNSSFDISFLVTCAAVGGIGNYRFSIDVIDNSDNVTNLYSGVSSGDYFISLLSVDDNSTIRVTVFDYTNNSSVKNFDIGSLPEFVQQLPPPEVNFDDFPEPSVTVDTGVAHIIADTFDVLPSEITALLIPVVLFCIVGWWLRK